MVNSIGKLCVWLVVFCGTVCFGRRKIPVGVLLHDETEIAEIVLKSAMRRFNLFNAYEFVPYMGRINNVDIFKTGQIVCNMTDVGILAIFGPDSAKTNEIVQSVSEYLELPQFQTFWNPKLASYAMRAGVTTQVFNLYPEPKLLAKALATLLREMHWKSYTIIYEDDDSLVRLQEVLKIHRADYFSVTIKKMHRGEDQRTLLKEIKGMSESHIILDCRTDRILEILNQAAQVKLMEEYHSYILTSLDAHTLDFNSLGHIRSNITTLRLVDPNNRNTKNIVHDWEFNEEQEGHFIKIPPNSVRLETALFYDALNLFLTVYTELEHTTKMEAKPLSCEGTWKTSDHGLAMAEYIKVRQLINGTIPGPITGPLIFDSLGRRTQFNLQVVELTSDDFRVTGTWDTNDTERINSTVTFQERQQEILQQKVFRVTSRIGAPYLMFRESPDGRILEGNNRFEGYSMDLIAGIADILNFTFRFELVPGNIYGRYDPKTKEWNGLIRQLLDRKADLAICDLTITYERGKAVDFSMPFMTLGISILYSKAVKEPPELLSFMHPLALDIWLYMATAYLALSFFIYVAARMAPGDWENPHPCNEEPEELENVWTFKNCLWLTLGSIMAQGCDILPKGLSTRMIASMWWFFSLIITSSYTANLAAFLTMERMGPTIESAEDLAKQTQIKYGCVDGGATSAFFRDSNFSTYQRMWRQMQVAEPSVFEQSNKEGVKRVKSSKRMYAFLMESSSIEYEMERDCELIQVGGWLDTKSYGIAMPVNSPYYSSISGAVLKMQEDGVLRKLKEKWWKQMHGGGKCNETKLSADDSAAELGIDHVGGVFVVLTGGVGIAFLIAIFEFLWNVRKISVEGQMSPRTALARELKFAMNVSVRKKAVVKKSPDTTKE